MAASPLFTQESTDGSEISPTLSSSLKVAGAMTRHYLFQHCNSKDPQDHLAARMLLINSFSGNSQQEV